MQKNKPRFGGAWLNEGVGWGGLGLKNQQLGEQSSLPQQQNNKRIIIIIMKQEPKPLRPPKPKPISIPPLSFTNTLYDG